MRTTIYIAILLATFTALPAFAQDGQSDGEAEEGSVFIPSNQTLDDEQKDELQKELAEEVTAALKKCVAKYPSPQNFTEVVTEYDLKKSGKLVGGYVGGAAPDPDLYVASEEERKKLEKEGAFTRKVVRNDRDLERCLKKATGRLDSGLDRYSAKISATFGVSWKGKTPTVEATTFDVKKSE